MSDLKVAVFGASGNMGGMVVSAIERAEGLSVVSALGSGTPRDQAEAADVAVDFTHREAALENIRWASERQIPIVVGTSGFGPEDLTSIASWSASANSTVLIVPNFSLSAYLTKQIAALVANYYSEAEIVEYYGAHKRDSPSGTSIDLARAIGRARETPFAAHEDDSLSRGETIDGVPIHAVRLNGYLSREDVLFGVAGESLSISFETSSREAYMSNVVRAVRAIPTLDGFAVGLDTVMAVSASADPHN